MSGTIIVPVGSFWSEAVQLKGSATYGVLRRVAIFGGLAALWTLIHNSVDPKYSLHVDVAPYEVAGAVVGLMMVLRTNAGYDRWWEGRKLWGSIINQSRSLAITSLVFGPADPEWRSRVVKRTACFGHIARRSLRHERNLPEVAALLGDEEARQIAESEHMPSAIGRRISDDLRRGLRGAPLLQAEGQRSQLIDHIGACERILATPLPMAYTIEIRRFIIFYLTTLPLALLDKVGWLTPVVTMVVAYPLLTLDKIGVELQNPFWTRYLNHLPLENITSMIEGNLLGLLEADTGPVDDNLAQEASREDDDSERIF